MTETVDRRPASLNHWSLQGDPFTFTFTVDQDLTGYSWTAQLRRSTSGPVVAAYEVSQSVDGSTTTVTVTLDAVATASLRGRYRWDIEHDGGGDATLARTLLGGIHDFDAEVSR